MTSNVTHIKGPFPAGNSVARSVFNGVADFLRSLKDRIARAAEIRRTYDMLNELDDRMLRDVGISRGEIRAVAIHSADHPDVPYHHYHRKSAR